MSSRLTSHPIVGESFTEFIDHDEEDAQGVAKAALTKRKIISRHVHHWSTLTHQHRRLGKDPCTLSKFSVPFRPRILNSVISIACACHPHIDCSETNQPA